MFRRGNLALFVSWTLMALCMALSPSAEAAAVPPKLSSAESPELHKRYVRSRSEGTCDFFSR